MLILLKVSLKLLSGFLLTLDKIRTVACLKRPDVWAQILALPFTEVCWSSCVISLLQFPHLGSEVKNSTSIMGT